MCSRAATACRFAYLMLPLLSPTLVAVACAPGARTEYSFKREAAKRVLLARSPFFYEGHLNDAGAFVPDPKAAPIEMNVAQEQGFKWLAELEKSKFPIFNLHRGGVRADAVYQYLAGDELIFGELSGDGDFLPIVENKSIKVITIAEYLKSYRGGLQYRIYNLPGRIVDKEGKEPQVRLP